MNNKKIGLELLHYIVVYAVILAAWIPLMEFFADNVFYTAFTVFIIFIAADQLMHRFVLGE